MRISRIILSASLGIALASGASSCAGTASPKPSSGTRTGPRFVLSLEPGPEYAKTMGFFPFAYTVWPQVAAWLETSDGAFIGTLYVTSRGDRGEWRAAPKAGRPEALPVWNRLRESSTDAVSSATTTESSINFGSGAAAGLVPGTYVIKLETNRSYDWNAAYTKDNSGVNGQPSIVYRAELIVGAGMSEAEFVPIGTGAVDGADGDIRPGLVGVDSALRLFSSMKASYLTE
ncbi:MAG: hypothetical protein KKA67_02395 [Spirochaetes bacterium]|nr:hypothetical protein [Spirochaetota bacterium]MBU1078979.1 hypothetical protein [Spirochaetota bacterium]